jgi:hypothetical protein
MFEARRGARTSYGKSSDLPSEVELADLSGLGIKNRVISCAIEMQFVSFI